MKLKSKSLQIGNHIFNWGSRTYVMGILNVTPDSFRGMGLLRKAIGSSSSRTEPEIFSPTVRTFSMWAVNRTRPGSQPVNADEEMERVIPVIEAIAKEFPDALISIDTYKAKVAEAAFKAGAHILNDVWALRADPDLLLLSRQFRVPVILMHNRSNPASVEVRHQLGNAYIGSTYENLMEDVKRELLVSVELA